MYATNVVLCYSKFGTVAGLQPLLSKDNANVLNINLQGVVNRLSRAGVTGVLNQGNSTLVSPNIVQPELYEGLTLLFEILENETLYKLNRSILYSRIKSRRLLLSTLIKGHCLP